MNGKRYRYRLKRYLYEGLVAFAYHNDHFNVDGDKSDKLPNKACSHKFYKTCRDHRCKVLVIRFYCFFYSLHKISFIFIVVWIDRDHYLYL